MDLLSLPHHWNRLARDRNDRSQALTLRRCAAQLELALHQCYHGAEFDLECSLCDWEREHNQRVPERDGMPVQWLDKPV